MYLNIGEVLTRAWQITWKYKVLWIFGILAGCTRAASSGGGNSGFRFSSTREVNLPPGIQQFLNRLNNLSQAQIITIIAIIALVILVLVVISIFLGTMGRIGLIRGTVQADQGAATLAFGELFRGGLRYFWRVFALNLVIGVAIFLVTLLFVALLFLAGVLSLGLVFICTLPLLCILIPALWILGAMINVVVEQSNIAIVVEDLGITAAIQRGWNMVTGHLGEYAVMALILLVGVSLVGGFIIGLPLLFIIFPALAAVLIGSQQALTSGLLIAGLCLVLYLPVFLALNGILQTYISSAWTLTYLRLSTSPAAIATVQPA